MCAIKINRNYFVIVVKLNEPVHEISNNLTCVDSDEPLQPPFKRRNSK